MDLEEENRLLRGCVVDTNTDINAYLEVKKENEFLKSQVERLIEDNRDLKRKLQRRRAKSLRTFIKNLFS